MKKSSIKKICTAIIVITSIGMILILLLNLQEQKPQFKFLKGNAPFMSIKESNSQIRKTHYIYSFETDCNDIFSIAIKELNDMDYKTLFSFSCDMAWSSWDDKDGNSTSVEFYRDLKLIEMSSTINNTTPFPIPFLHKELCCDGWISIRITQEKEQNKLIFEFKQFLQRLRSSQ